MESHFHIQITALLDVLMKTAVSDICALAESWVQSLQNDIRISQKENENLKQKLQIMEQQQCPSETRKNNKRTHEETDPGSELRNDTCKVNGKSVTESVASKRGQWCVVLNKWNPMLKETEAELMDRSIIGREEEKLDATSRDVDYTPVCVDANVNNPDYGLKTEQENVLPGLQKTEYTADVGAECEQNETDYTQHISQPKREEEDQFDICLLTPDLQLNSTHLFKDSQSTESTTCPMQSFNLDKDFNLSSAAQNVSRFTERTSASSTCEKQSGATFICNICGKTLTTKATYICHMRLHTGERPFKCAQCGKRFAKKFNLSIHYNVHSGARPYACSVCPRSFADPSALGRHKMIHSTKSQSDTFSPKCKFNCNICGHNFSSKYSLAVHFQAHAAEKPYIVQNVLF